VPELLLRLALKRWLLPTAEFNIIKIGLRSILFVGEAVTLILAQGQQR